MTHGGDPREAIAADARSVLRHWRLEGAAASLRPLGSGLINETFAIDDGERRFVLQRVNPIFDGAIHDNITAVCRHLRDRGFEGPQLVETAAGDAWIDDRGTWRLQTAVTGVSHDALRGPEQAEVAGAFVGRWHATLADLDHAFVAVRAGVHDTPRHLDRLRAALVGRRDHPLHAAVAELGRALLDAAETLPALPDDALELRVAHGDLKINNLLFAPGDPLRPIALIDLDTVAPMALAFELGDAWRSWCNRADENQPEAEFDLDAFAASLRGWRRGWTDGGGRRLGDAERTAMLLGPEWISLELAARFAADALFEDYFGWDPARFESRGHHNLQRARGQWSLHRAFADSRGARADLLDR